MENSKPVFIPKVFNDTHYDILRNRMEPIAKTFPYNNTLGRYRTVDGPNNILTEFAKLYLFNAMDFFGSETLRPTYGAFGHYESSGGITPALPVHTDDFSACTYTVDMCLYQTEPWDIVIEGNAYTLLENQAVAFRGCDLRHYRPPFPNPENQHVAMVFFHYAEPDHWFFTKGADYTRVLQGEISEDEWQQLQAVK